MINTKQIKNNTLILQGSIAKGLLTFFFPILLGTFFQQLYNTVDAVIVGRFVGKEALAAVGGGTTVYVNMLVGFFTGLAGGAGVVISQFYGAGNKKECSQSVHTSLILAVVAGLVIMAAGVALSLPAMILIGTPKEIMIFSVTYLRLFFCGMIPMTIYNMAAGILRALGDSKTPFFVLLVGCFFNIVLDLLFVVALKQAVVGVAVATIISQAICAIITLCILYKSQDMIKLNIKDLSLCPYIAKKMVLLGLPTGLQSVMYTISNLIIQSNVNALGTGVIAGVAAWGKIDQFFWTTIASFGVALTTFSGQNFGALNIKRIKKATIECLGMSALATVILSCSFFALGELTFKIFTDDRDVIAVGMQVMHLLCPLFITYISVEILSGALRGAGKTAVPTLLTLFGVCVLRLLWMFFVVPYRRSVLCIFISYPITWGVTSLLFWLYYIFGKWEGSGQKFL